MQTALEFSKQYGLNIQWVLRASRDCLATSNLSRRGWSYIELNESLWDLERLENLEAYLQEKTGVPQEAILAYLSDGRRLTKDNVRDLAGVQDQSIYTFNKRYLDIDLEQALHELRVDAPLQPPWKRELDKQTKLLTGLDGDLEVIRKVKVHREFVSATVRKAMDAGEKGRTLGDYVSTRGNVEAQSGSDEVRIAASDQIPIEDAESCARRSMEDFERIMDLTAQVESEFAVILLRHYGLLGIKRPHLLEVLANFRQADSALRSELQFMIQLKNSYTEQCIVALRRISTLNNDLVDLPPALSSLQAGFKGKTSFSHIQRLHNMLYAYGATVVEIVRRKEFARFFYQRSQSILEIMAKLTANERKRRHLYRGEVQGQLPFDVRGMDDAVPSIDFSPTGSLDFTYSLERADIDMLLQILNDLDDFANSSEDPAALSSVKELVLVWTA
ncbi:hypothetical protein A0H81_12706 [Grifola frondosa]|uniref:Autophagy-related protein 11 n=1 Tax=Grifola frondosa TaxID=5627 RepID=A0A1C7LTK8_GRIFR|nr:hypothetical protein A0H81_12706 [Grifola frondosa]